MRGYRDSNPFTLSLSLCERDRCCSRTVRWLARETLPRTDRKKGKPAPMGSPSSLTIEITPQVLLKAYACGIFPMAESAEDPTLYWIEPERRGILALDQLHVPARLARTVRAERFSV